MKEQDLSVVGRAQILIITEGIKGAIKWVAEMSAIGFVALVLVALAIDHFSPRDSSDSDTERSGLRVRTDALTGCQYLETSKGAITPRIDSDGEPVCNEDRP